MEFKTRKGITLIQHEQVANVAVTLEMSKYEGHKLYNVFASTKQDTRKDGIYHGYKKTQCISGFIANEVTLAEATKTFKSHVAKIKLLPVTNGKINLNIHQIYHICNDGR